MHLEIPPEDTDLEDDPMPRLEPLFRILRMISPLRLLISIRLAVEDVYSHHKNKLWAGFGILCLCLYLVYVGFALE